MNHKKKAWLTDRFMFVCFLTLSVLILFPTMYMMLNTFMSQNEILRCYSAALSPVEGQYATLHLLPDLFSLEGYYQVLVRRPDYLIKFWNSLYLCGGILLGQTLVSVTGGFAFAKYDFPLKKGIFFLLVLLMLMPVQVTLVPNYIVLDGLHLTDTWWALILPAAFAPFGTFLMTQIFKSIPNEILDAARLDGASTSQVMLRVLVPAGKGGLIGLFLLTFIDAWNMVEQPVVFLRTSSQYPLSVFLASVNAENFSLSFVCGALAMLPVVLMFLFFQEELVQGIEFSGLK